MADPFKDTGREIVKALLRGWDYVAGNGNWHPIRVDENGRLEVVQSAGTATIGTVGIDQATPGTTNKVVSQQETYSTVRSGELAGTAAALQLPSVACKLVRFKARADNVGYVYLGGAGVTVPNGTTDITTGLELSAGDDSGWLPVTNLNVFWRITNNAGDDLTYLCLV